MKFGEYDLELEKAVSKIKSEKAKLVLLQFPDGLKPYATAVVDYLEDKLAPKGVHSVKEDINTECKFLIWFGDCFGACDTPNLGTAGCIPKSLGQDVKVDLVIQFGHNSMMPSY